MQPFCIFSAYSVHKYFWVLTNKKCGCTFAMWLGKNRKRNALFILSILILLNFLLTY